MEFPYQPLLDAAPDAMVVVDQSGAIVLVNVQAESLFGYTRAELLGKPTEVLLPQQLRDSHLKLREGFFDAPSVRTMGERRELYGRRKDGSEFPVEISLSPVQSKQGSLVASTIRDATIHREIERRLTGILENSLNEVYIFDPKTLHFLQVNKGARSNLGYSMQELSQLTPVDIEVNETADSFDKIIQPLRDDEKELQVFETVHQRKDGSTYPVEVHLQLSKFETAPVFVAIILDITERRQAEQALRDSHQQLEERVVERTTALEEARKESEQARKNAEHANTGKSRFLAAASHDLRQPLQSLGLYLSVMRGRLDSPDLLDLAHKMRVSLDTMGDLMDALLDISKLDGGSITPEKSDFRIQKLFDRIVTDNIQQATEKGLVLECVDSDCVLHTDSGLLERVLENFIVNAICYTEEGRVSIACQCRDGMARISVVDTGVGIPSQDLERVFDEYFQLDNQARVRRKGLGLGLSIVKYISRLLGHPIGVESTPGDGSMFWIDVPAGQAVPAAVAATLNGECVRGRSPIVLFVDDDPAILDATTMLLESADITVHSALSGEEALAHLNAGVRPDILITDYWLPEYNGIEVVRRVRQATIEDLPAILITGDTSGDEIRLASLANCTVLRKPVDTNQLFAVIEDVGCEFKVG